MFAKFRQAVFGVQTALLLLLVATPAVADVGAISVEVIDAVTRRPLDGVTVTAESRGGDVSSATTDNGRALLDSLQDGFFEFRAELAGYATAVEPAVRVLEQRTGSLRFELQPASYKLDDVVVVARAREADPFGAVSDRFLSRDELRNAPGSGSDVMRALSGLPGVVSNGEFASFSVRGHGPRSNLIYVDGFPFQQVAHFEQTLGKELDIVNGGRYSIFAPNAVAGAEFSPGGWSAQYGGRNGSLLQFEVVDGAPSPVGSLRLDLAGAEILYEGPSGFHDDTSMFLQARRFDFGKFFETIDEEALGAPVSSDLILKTRTRLSDDDDFEFLAIYAPEKYTRDINHVLAAEEDGGIEDVTLQNDEQDLALIGGTWRRWFGSDGEWTNRIYYRESDRVSSEGEAFPDLVPPGTPADQVPVRERLLTVKEKESEVGWRSDVSFGNRAGIFRAGLHLASSDLDYSTELREDWIRYIYESDDPRPPGANYIVLQPDEINSIYSASETNYAVYGEQAFDWGDATLRAGIRYDRNGFGDEDLVSPRFGFNYVFSPRLQFSATAGIFHEPPSNLARAADPDNFDLESEELTHFSLGFDYRLSDNLKLLVEAYYQDIDNRLVESGRTSGRISNDGEGTNTGVDLVLTRRFNQGWSADFVYSWNRYKVDDNDGRGEYDWDFNREHFVSFGGRWEINSRWQVGARWKYGSGHPTYRYLVHEDVLAPNPPSRYSQERTALNVARGDAFHSLDVRVDYRRRFGPVDLVLFADVLNVYGGPAGLQPEFNILTGEIVDDEEETLPLLGLIIEYAW
ncbi:MAG TPA: TonB-dependent receptor plug domain-containing protein [Azoarcus taiwanensis]|nr:TonB-dependent receptor plug domain-containing protein [Azoarcus taiwanensis]